MSTVLGNLSLDISFGEFLWSLLIIFFMIVFFVILFQVVFDLFRDHELSGWAKAGLLILIIVLPFLCLFIYLIVRGKGMAERSAARQQQAQKEFDGYVRNVAATGEAPAAEQIARAKELLDTGAINQAEFDRLKAKALA